MSNRIPLARPSIGDSERSAALRVLSGTQLTNGPELVRFEGLLAAQAKRRHAIAVSSGTAALELSLWAMGIGPGDSVLVTAFGFPAAANAVAARGARAIAVDVDADHWLMDFELARAAVEASTKAIVTIDQLGMVTPASQIEALTAETGIPVISDAACGLGGSDAAGRPGGCAGTVGTFSFHPRKVVTTGEGGAIVCDDDDLATRLRRLRNHGQTGGGFAFVGTNARLDEVSSALGCAQLARLDAMIAERTILVSGYHERLAELGERGLLSWQQLPEGATHAHQTFAVRLASQHNRATVLKSIREREIDCGVATYSFTELEIHPNAGPAVNAKALHDSAIALPLYIGMRSGELDRVCDALSAALGQGTK